MTTVLSPRQKRYILDIPHIRGYYLLTLYFIGYLKERKNNMQRSQWCVV